MQGYEWWEPGTVHDELPKGYANPTWTPTGNTPRCKWCRCGLKACEVMACDECKDYAAELGMTVDEAMQPDPQDGGRIVPRRIVNAMLAHGSLPGGNLRTITETVAS